MGGFCVGEALQRSNVFGLSSNTWLGITIDLCLATLGVYLAGLIAYAVLLTIATTFFSRTAIEHFASNLPRDTSNNGNLLHAPFSAIGNLFWARMR